jgi:DNA-binding helix-hairpin-helix protein with protein kinase domain
MLITIRQKVYAAGAIAAIIISAVAIQSVRSRLQISRLERVRAVQEQNAARSEHIAAAAKQDAARQTARAEFLEQQLVEIRALAIKQDEELQKLNSDTDSARGRLDRTRGIRSVESTVAELCKKLAAVGHGCDE